jgi:hypothetical protein
LTLHSRVKPLSMQRDADTALVLSLASNGENTDHREASPSLHFPVKTSDFMEPKRKEVPYKDLCSFCNCYTKKLT